MGSQEAAHHRAQVEVVGRGRHLAVVGAGVGSRLCAEGMKKAQAETFLNCYTLVMRVSPICCTHFMHTLRRSFRAREPPHARRAPAAHALAQRQP